MNKQEHLLVVFAEELGEVSTELLDLQKQVFKSLRFGIDEQRDLPTSNRERIEAEWQDLLGCVEKLKEVGIELRPDITAIKNKMDKVEKYCNYAESIGTISSGGMSKDEVIKMLIAVARAAHSLADGTCDENGIKTVDNDNFEELSVTLDALDELPEPGPNLYGTGPAKAESFLIV